MTIPHTLPPFIAAPDFPVHEEAICLLELAVIKDCFLGSGRVNCEVIQHCSGCWDEQNKLFAPLELEGNTSVNT